MAGFNVMPNGRKCLITCTAMVVMALQSITPSSADSLSQLVAEALTHHPNIAVSRAEEEVAKSQLKEVKSGYLPPIDLQYQIEIS